GMVADEDRDRSIGAFDADSVRENRRLDDLVGKKRANVKNVHFNVTDVLMLYDTILRYQAPNSIAISVKRLTGTPVQQMITSQPRSGAELYEALRLIHGPSQEASYEVSFVDAADKRYRGKGNITMPDASRTQAPQQQQQPVAPPYGQQVPAYGQPSPGYGFPPPQSPPPGYPPAH